MYARAKSPVYEYTVGSGAKAAARRAIADTNACLKCHVGSLYQHGNNRVDNVELCVMCHNSASTEQNRRVSSFGVDASEAYDGKVGQTFELKTMLHAIHSAGNDGAKPIVIYRTRGIYAWAPEGVIPPNWPTGPTECTSGQGPGHFVFGADPASTSRCQVHNLHHPTWPRAVNDCAACHASGFSYMVDQTKAVATTLDAGGTTWTNQLDDVLQGAQAAACTTCHAPGREHQSSATAGHANQNGWAPSVFPNGRQTIIDAAK
jgi:OmcA/MtrC family decaheme c-type cytochrome